MNNEVAAYWGRIVAWYEANTPPGTLRLPPGIDEDLIQVAEAEIGLRLPGDVRTFYRMHDGLDGSSLLHYGEFLSLEFLLGEHSTTPRPGEPGADVAPHDLSGPIKPTWWSLMRAKIVDNSGDGVMVDLDPAPGGTVGQIILFDHEMGPRRVLAPSFAEWLARLARALEAGKLAWHPVNTQVEPPGYSEPGGYLKNWEADWA
jgi:cell wall assembly regulator SMI1